MVQVAVYKPGLGSVASLVDHEMHLDLYQDQILQELRYPVVEKY
jgi:hypothetical protein